MVVLWLCLLFTPHSLLMSASTDKTGAVWDVEVGQDQEAQRPHFFCQLVLRLAKRNPVGHDRLG